MIATLNGKVSEKLADLVIIEVNGVGYGLYVSAEDHGKLKAGENTKVHVYEHIRENTHDLFGFTSLDNKYLFELLLGVNGVGPKMALNILSSGSSSDVKKAIADGDVKYIQAANGVGKRVAERVVVDLKDKVGLSSSSTEGIFMSTSTAQKDEAAQALIALGFSPTDAIEALSNVPTDLPSDKRVKQALKAVG